MEDTTIPVRQGAPSGALEAHAPVAALFEALYADLGHFGRKPIAQAVREE